MPEVQYSEFKKISDLAHETANIVNTLVPAVKQLAETSKETLHSISLLREQISSQQTEILKSSGDLRTQIYEIGRPDRNTIITHASVLLGFLAIVGTIGKLYVDSSIDSLDKDISRIENKISDIEKIEILPQARAENVRINTKIEHLEKTINFHRDFINEIRNWQIQHDSNK